MPEFSRTTRHPDHSERDERGASAVEYGLLIAGIAAIIVAAVFLFGTQVESLFGNTCNSLQSQRGAAACQ